MVERSDGRRAAERRFHRKFIAGSGPNSKDAHSSSVETSRHTHMRELRIQHEGRPYRVLYAFDPRRAAMLLIGGDKTGNDRWYAEFVPIADSIYDRHLRELENE